MHVITATHWDREWLLPFEGYRIEFVKYTDKLIRILEKDPEFRHYHLDGQSICLEDYLAIRPEKREKMRSLVRDGRMLIGPWYTLPDMSLISGEAIIRNLQTGIRISNELGGSMREGYTPCSNGQISQLPQIYAGFGIYSAVIYKGIRDERAPREFRWFSPDGTEILTLHLSARYGRSEFYCLLFQEVICNVVHDTEAENWNYDLREGHIPFRISGQEFHNPGRYDCLEKKEGFYEEHLKSYLRKLRNLASRGAATSQLVVFHGMDHTPPYASTPKLIAAANECFDDLEVIDSSLPEAIAALRREINWAELKVHKGELRDTGRDEKDRNTNIATLSARLDIKTANRKTEHLLIDSAEPVCTWAWLKGARYPLAILNHAWKLLLANHGHDSLDGCSVNKVSRDILRRFTDGQTICEGLIKESLFYLARKAGLKSSPDKSSTEPFLMIFNPSLYRRDGFCEMMVDIPGEEKIRNVCLIDEKGKRIIPQIKFISTGTISINSTITRPLPAVSHYQMLFETGDIAPMNWLNLKVNSSSSVNKETDISSEPKVLENKYLKAEILSDGRFNLVCKETGRGYEGLHWFEDKADNGNPWNYEPLGNEKITSLGKDAEIELIENGPMRATYRVKIILDVPSSWILPDKEKKEARRELVIVSEISLTRCGRYLDIKTAINNSSKFHKLTVCFPTGLKSDSTYAGGQYDVLERPTRLPEMSGWKEPVTGYPNYGFAGLSDNKSGFSVLNIGLPEYFIEGEANDVLTLTLLRAVQLKEHWPADLLDQVSDGHCLGTSDCRYAVYPHAGDWKQANLWPVYREFARPLIGTQYFGPAMPGRAESLVSVDPSTLEISCLKKAEKEEALVIRLWNPLEEPQKGIIKIACGFSGGQYVDFNEELLDNAEIDLKKTGKDTICFTVGKKKIVTLLFRGVR